MSPLTTELPSPPYGSLSHDASASTGGDVRATHPIPAGTSDTTDTYGPTTPGDTYPPVLP